jgi:ribosomal protein S18 acetylase RimI-like enzyme
MLRLVPMTQDEFVTTVERINQQYAREKVRAGSCPREIALARAEEETHSLLPAGLQTPGQYLFTLVNDEGNKTVGRLWFGLRDDGGGPYVWVWDLWIDEDCRRRGYATAALAALADRVRVMGMTTISLHVFGHNLAARRLYDKLGFDVASLWLSKRLD